VSMTDLLREAVALLRGQEAARSRSDRDILERTRGIWRRGRGLAWQNRLRDEW